MQCTRCAGMKVPEVIVEGGARFIAMRCIHCGDIIDHVILANRRRCRPMMSERSRTSIDERYQPVWRRPALINSEQSLLDGLGVLNTTSKKARGNQREEIPM